MESFDDVFRLLGGAARVAVIIGKSTEHASAMRRRKSIPIRYWPTLISAASSKNLELNADILLRLHAVELSRMSVDE